MSSNFFEQQDVARRNTGVLVLLFLAAVVLIILAVYAIFTLVFVNLSDVETVAGRPAYAIDLGENNCVSASAPHLDARHTVWVDKETAFILRYEVQGTAGQGLLQRIEVEEISYNVPLDAALSCGAL